MRAISSKINMSIRNVSIINNNIEGLVLRTILWSFLGLALCYVFLLGNMVFNIVERRSLEKYALSLSNEVRDMELTYLSVSNNIDLAFAHSLGFKETKPKFATRRAVGFISPLSLKLDNEI